MQEANGQQLDKNSLVPSIVGKDEVIIHKWLVEDISKLSKSNKGSIKGDNNSHQNYYSHQHWHNAKKDCQALQRIIYQHCHMAPLVLTYGQQEVQLNLLPKYKGKAATILFYC